MVDVPHLARVLAKQPPGFILSKLRYYTSPSPNPNPQQQRFFDALRQSSSTELILGRHESRSSGASQYHVEKETDVKLTVDMVTGAYKNLYDTAMLITGDTDFVPAVLAVREAGKRVIWCHFRGQGHSDELRQVCDESLEMDDKLLRTCRRDPWRR